ncbi:tetratricopeptide repeat protein [Indioceanicola profundi]|uniref:tetratricopeptide repeat protein n=1 Tax=Indioceanicola profundi TaxID=2220096 RepID=UPI000E6AA393|nr:tetratricopeptide repeat protein [Indioceanicola profundi]
MSDIFREVDEDLRRDQAQKIWKRFGPALIAAALIVVAATASYTLWQRARLADQRERTAVLTRAIEAAVPEGAAAPSAEAADELAAAAAQLDGGHATLARLYQAAALANGGQREQAVAVYDEISGSAEDPLLRDLASLHAVLHQIDSGDPAQLQSRLAPLASPTSPWRWSARELTGLLAIRTGDTARAGSIFRELAADAEAPAGIRTRATELAALYPESK